MMQKGKRAAAAVSVQPGPATHLPPEAGLDRNVQARIGDNLRAMYDDLLQQPVPDRFKDLLGQLENQKGGTERSR